MAKLTPSDIFDINRKTGALVLGKNRLDDYAEKYLMHHCPEALLQPMPIPVDRILKEEGLTVEKVQLSENLDIFGCCMLLDGEVKVYDKDTQTMVLKAYPAGTILVDPLTASFRGEGAKRNTLIHEVLHWEKDKKYFEILAIKNKRSKEKLFPMMCRRSETFYEPSAGSNTKVNEVRWLEWQAHRLAPRVLMPKVTFTQKALELLDAEKAKSRWGSCDTLIEELSKFFIVSRISAKYRLLEVGLKEVLSELPDFDAVFSDINQSKDFVRLTEVEAGALVLANEDLQKWLNSGRFIFADGYFVIAIPKYVAIKDGVPHLTANAKKHLEKCVINIRAQKYIDYPHLRDDLGQTFLYSGEGIDARILAFHPEAQTALSRIDSDEAVQSAIDAIFEETSEERTLVQMASDPYTTLCECLWFAIHSRHWTPEQFNEETLLHKDYLGRIRRGTYSNMGTDVLMAICVALQLKLSIVEMLFKKSVNNVSPYQEPYKTYYTILSNFPKITIDNFNLILQKRKMKELGSTIKEF